jgi:hypothetical protein
MTDFNVAHELLEDGEHVSWAHESLAPRRNNWKYAYWGGYILLALVMGYWVFKNIRPWQHFHDVWANPEVWRIIVIGGVAIFATWLIQRWAGGKSWIPGNNHEQDEFYVGLISNQRVLLLNANYRDDIILYPGEISGIYLDYSNGARALRLDLSNGEPSVTIVTSGDIAEVKQLIERGFVDQNSTSKMSQ